MSQSVFLNSRSMLTPGVAGATTMLIANTLYQQFDVSPRWTALSLSFALGSLVFGDRTVAPWQRALLYLLNSLIIFSMAIGANAVGQATTPPPVTEMRGLEAPARIERPFFSGW